MGEWICGLEVVRADGSVLRTGAWAAGVAVPFSRAPLPDVTGLFVSWVILGPLLRLLVILAFTLGTQVARAHPIDAGYLRIERSDTRLIVVLELESAAVAPVVAMTPEEVQRVAAGRATELAAMTYRLSPITTEHGPCAWRDAEAKIQPGTATLVQTATAECPRGFTAVRWELPVIRRLAPTFELLVKAYVFRDHVATLRPDAHVLELTSSDSASRGFLDLLWSGIRHIGAAPGEWHDEGGFKLAEGLDHVLFILALLLRGGTWRRLVGIVTGFTLGHSVTLALASLGVVRVSSDIIEPLVALTIALTAAEVYVGRFEQYRWKIATAFGLVHGFAFANALSGLELSGGQAALALLAFNVGVELGQLIIVALVAPAIVLLHRYRPTAAGTTARIAAVGIFVAALYWFVERISA